MHIFCGGMPRSGSTLQFQLTASIVECAGAGRRLPWIAPSDLHSFLLPNPSSIDVCKSHVPAATIINRINDGRATGLYIHRDLRDVVVSTMFKHKIAFNNVMESTTLSDAIAWGKTWESLPGVLIQRYADLLIDIPGAIDEICEHINIDLCPETKTTIFLNHQIDSQRKKIEAIPDEQLFHSSELLHHGHIGKGNGQSLWRSILAGFQVEQIVDKYGDWLEGHGYE